MSIETAIVTGASRGIGLALVQRLQARGVHVFASGRDRQRLEALSASTGCCWGAHDLEEAAAPLALYRDACAQLGRAPDALVNNAGFNSRKTRWVDVTEEELERQYRVNLRAPALLCREALRDMQARGSGHIVNVLSSVVQHGCESMGTYSLTKHGLHGLTRVLIKEARPFGVKVSGVYPGGVDTDFREAERPDYMRPDSVAQLIVDAVLFAPADAVVHELTFRPMIETNF